MNEAALVVIVAAAAWIVWTGALMAARPEKALDLLRMTASTQRINLTEQGLRLTGGLALMVRSPAARTPDIFWWSGVFIVFSSIALIIVPLRWHAGYANWWADRLPLAAVRGIGPVTVAAAVALVYAAL